MWQDIWLSFGKAFDLIGEGNQLLAEIVATTMEMAIKSSLLAFIIGVPVGILLASSTFHGKKILVTILRTCMGLPPVAVGILVYMLFSGIGPFGSLGLIYSVNLMVIAQVILITPIVAGMVETALTPISMNLKPTIKGLRINKGKEMFLTINEGKYQLIAVFLFAFARSTAEVGAVQIVGGNILHKTRIMTTAIALNYNTGSFQMALALAIILILIALGVNVVATLLQMSMKKR
ncbi:MAG: ABC transporter permease [Clostridia bacterium]